MSAAAQGPFELDLGVAEFTARAARATIELAAEDDAHAHAAFDCDNDEVGAFPAQTKGGFGHRNEVGIVVDKDGAIQLCHERVAEIDISLGQGGGPVDEAGLGLNEAGEGDTDARDILRADPGGFGQLIQPARNVVSQ